MVYTRTFNIVAGLVAIRHISDMTYHTDSVCVRGSSRLSTCAAAATADMLRLLYATGLHSNHAFMHVMHSSILTKQPAIISITLFYFI